MWSLNAANYKTQNTCKHKLNDTEKLAGSNNNNTTLRLLTYWELRTPHTTHHSSILTVTDRHCNKKTYMSLKGPGIQRQ